MSQDVFLKMMLVRYGGFGYGYILKHFVPRLKRHGMDQRIIGTYDREPAAGFLRRTSR
jgi:phosphotriesterase-related protein